MRKLATVRVIKNIEPIPDADKIVKLTVDGWHVVASKTDGFKIGDLVVYIEIDSVMPEKPEYEFLRSRKFRVRTIILRGQISQGLVLPLTILPQDKKWKVGDDVTDILGVTKYDPELEQENKVTENQGKKKPKNPIVKWLCRFKWFRNWYYPPKISGNFPDWIKKTDEERIENIPHIFDFIKENNISLSVTEKVDGTSATFFLKKQPKKNEFGVCSRNRRLVTEDDSYYWTVARNYKIKETLEKLIGDHEWIVLQGEITGQGIQGNKYPIDKGYKLWAFNLITPEKRYSTEEMQPILGEYGIMTVPIVNSDFKLPDTIDDLVEYVQGSSQIVQREREGCVFRNEEKKISFKCINPKFLLKNDG